MVDWFRSPWLRSAIDSGIEKGVQQAVDSFDWDGAIRDALRGPKYKWFWFVKAMQTHVSKADPNLSDKQTMDVAAKCYRTFLRDNKTHFGDPKYDWSAQGAKTLIYETELDYWN